jgi:hypothetical protein
MKRSGAVAAVALGLLLVAAAPAGAAGPSLKTLQSQVNSLRAQLTSTKSKLTKLDKQVNNKNNGLKVAYELGLLSGFVAFCDIAATADAFQGTWAVIEQQAGKSIFGPQNAVDDSNVCSIVFRIARQSGQVPPTVGVFAALLNLLKGRAAPALVPWYQPVMLKYELADLRR